MCGGGLWVSLAIGVGAGVSLGGEVLMMSCGDVSVCGVLCGVGFDGA